MLQGYSSYPVKIRIFNNYALNSTIATAMNVRLTTYDGLGAGSHTASQLPASRQWIRVYQSGYGEGSVVSGLFTAYGGSDTAIGGDANLYYAERGSNGAILPQIRAGTGTNGLGFIEVITYAQLPSDAPSGDYTFALTMSYEWTP